MNERTGFRLAYELEKATETEAEILIYSEIYPYKFEDTITANEFDKLLKEAKKSGASSLRLRINSPGGSVYQAVAMKTMVETAGFSEIHVDIEGLCASAATFFLCVPNAYVRVADGSEVMIHNPSMIALGTAQDLEECAERLRKMQENQYGWYSARTGQSKEQIREWMDKETWFTAQEAVEAGLADEVTASGDAAACADAETLELMRGLYQAVPEEIYVRTGETRVAIAPPSENTNQNEEETKMDIKELTEEQLRDGNPQLFESLVQRGAAAERDRIREIDALADEGFEELAQQAKDNGTSAADFLKQVVEKRKERKAAFRTARQAETAPAAQVAGGTSGDNDGPAGDKEMEQFAREVAAMAPNDGVYDL